MNNGKHPLRLLPPEALLKTGKVDHADWNFRPLLGFIMHMRYRLLVSILSKHRFHRLLEVGYGSGVFMPELSHYCDELYGIDIHHRQQSVSELLARFNVTAQLFSGNVVTMPFSEKFFDCVVAISTLEFVEDLDAACVEIKRVLKPSGFFIVVTPGYSPVVDFGLRVLTGNSAKHDFGNRRQSLMPTLLKQFIVQQQRTMPPFCGSLVRLYTALKLSPPVQRT